MDRHKIKKDHKEENLAIKKLSEELEKVKNERESYKNKYLRALADYQNYEKRVKDERNRLMEVANSETILKLLPFLDDLDKAEIFVKDPGLKIIKDKFTQTLKEIGLEEIQILKKQFDPHTAEAIDVVEGNEDNIVNEVLRKGYLYKGKVLRVAQVKVTKKLKD
ncbi:nucleotide exchange factor GrpE [Candidatus Roizmanbacteria bacterium RIFCSPHIGHO2_02_FULL_37_15]|uniref:Protein GrpE n=1 Tax=Candidatus Roizmanbacteria bacterium RIFCSPLOWO2_01_FULL_37_16 TaxID=1802058 RepID=A0A1F7IPP7_9BACT|nr:MAG: nucleotide exchange factor GrpE [Candidatus Roizmanbacteria bacterium RIFCSPHIGHO2_01_FULL_37_16b]OGK21478.1 MAG: nucleotide exchange factor GrpE [Candidatus Roizmanbacteria bacterium RIFCSPHIGHO2_02_FULL_37_15]OGK34118.1 MAG: nucleotide exchange factor GrpE [Candidatus Roizmanbacteria bacterium RIFCSPHIGHO2_12_FULL_36_11]OGK45348.1 MAG: nucleotide exchange factor GrpE [Candidatus Roizmanbacteria bacterium RIFCSPLOWO2_01_FULL_37_16]